MTIKDESYMGWIDLHERAWAEERYDGRPTLDQMMCAPVLAFWYPTRSTHERFTATVHESLRDVNVYLSKLLVECRFAPPERRLARLFMHGRRTRIRGVRVLVEEIGPQE